jgi:hypothetical protein
MDMKYLEWQDDHWDELDEQKGESEFEVNSKGIDQ